MSDEGIALRLMHLYRLLGAATDGQAKVAIQREIDVLTQRLDEAFAEADIARQAVDHRAHGRGFLGKRREN